MANLPFPDLGPSAAESGSPHVGVVDQTANLRLIVAIFSREYPGHGGELESILSEVLSLYNGGWVEFEACQTGYHNLEHAIESSLAALRMLVGWNHNHPQLRFPSSLALVGVVAALFHDSGYLKDRNDLVGRGGKLLFEHVARSQRLAVDYCRGLGWDEERLELLHRLIGITDFNTPPDFSGLLATYPGKELASIIGSADLVAQMADPHYIARLSDLYEELVELYEFLGAAEVARRKVLVFSSVEEMRAATKGFYENLVVPRLDLMGRMFTQLEAFFGGNSNPYMESIAINMYSDNASGFNPWEGVGLALVEMGLVSRQVVDNIFRAQPAVRRRRQPRNRWNRMIQWLDDRSGQDRLGELLARTEGITPQKLRQLVEEHLLPAKQLQRLSSQDLAGLLRIGMILSGVRHMPQMFTHVVNMLTDVMECQASSILLPDEENSNLVIVKAAGPFAAKVEGQVLPWNKGLAGWVFTNRRSAAVNNAKYDNRFFSGLDQASGFITRSILAVPIMADNHTIGVLEAINKNGESGVFDQRDLFMLNIVAHQMAGALDAFSWMMENGALDTPDDHLDQLQTE